MEYLEEDINFFLESYKGFLFDKEQCQKNLNKLVPNANLSQWFPNKELINQGKVEN